MEGDWELGRNPRKGGEERREVVARGGRRGLGSESV